tara:strand:+ start:2548 stop:2865 length:318 start_codon:yes stop_codon:yes gene_type:complete
MSLKPIFYFMNENVSLIEVEYKDNFHWLLISEKDKKITPLDFLEMGEEIVNENKIMIRKFKDGELRFDDQFGKFTFQNDGHILMSQPPSEIPEATLQNISDYLNK